MTWEYHGHQWVHYNLVPPPPTIRTSRLWLCVSYQLEAVFPNHFARGHLFAPKITTDPQVHADVNIECPDHRYLKLNIYSSELILDSCKYQYIRNKELHDLTLTL